MTQSRRKGVDRERELAKLLAKALGDPAIARKLEQTRGGGYDLEGPSLRHVAIEVKAGEAPKWAEWLRQAREQAEASETHRIPVLAYRANGQPWRFLADLELLELVDLLRLLNALRDGYVVRPNQTRGGRS